MNDQRTRPLRLSGPVRRLIRLAHLIAALGWIGVDVVFGVLAVTGFTSEDLGTVAACYRALDIFVVPLLLLFGLTTVGTGLILSLSSGWGVIRYWWVAAKLLVNVILSGLVFLLLAPRHRRLAMGPSRGHPGRPAVPAIRVGCRAARGIPARHRQAMGPDAVRPAPPSQRRPQHNVPNPGASLVEGE